MFEWLFGRGAKILPPRQPRSFYWKVSAWIQKPNNYTNYGTREVIVKGVTSGQALSEGVEALRQQFPVSQGWVFSQLHATYLSE
jgi:hypothetical protein